MPAPTDTPRKGGLCAREVDYRSGEQRFDTIAARAGSVWLDSGSADIGRGRYEVIATRPNRSMKVRQIEPSGGYRLGGGMEGDIFDLIQHWRHGPIDVDAPLPFYGGCLGYLGYDINQSLERLVPPGPNPAALPLAWLAYYPWALVQDIATEQAWLVADSATALEQAGRSLELMDATPASHTHFELRGDWRASSSEAGYIRAIGRIQGLIDAGDCYQVNLSQHFQAAYSGDPWQAYRRLRRVLPSPFSAFINTGNGCLMSHSPERLLLLDNGQLTASPIKGTRPRGDSPARDAALARELLDSPKDRAENLMIVDLLRNDLGKSCIPGSIAAESLFKLESFPNVHHLVSTVSGLLRPEISAAEALRNAFPGGSVTGAPKIRAMDIINELEPVARSAYCGSIFYHSNHGRLDSNIAIRTLVADDRNLHCWGGGGIVADSVPREEYAESLTKIDVLLKALLPRNSDSTRPSS